MASSKRKRFWMFVPATLCAVMLPALGAHADSSKFPKGQIILLVPTSPGGFLDIAARLIAKDVTARTGTSIILDFRQGGGGTVALQALRLAAPDGRTLLEGHSGTNTINPAISSKLPYDPVNDFEPLTSLVYTPTVFVVPSSSPARTLAGLAALADAKPLGLSFGSAGTGTSSHVVGEMFKVATGKNMVHVPYKGTGPMMADMVGGRLDFTATSYSAVQGYIAEGQLRALSVPAKTRLAQIPNVPTTAEAGYPTVVLDYWAGLFAPAGTPADIAEAISEEFNKTLSNPDMIKVLGDRGLIAKGSTPAEFKAQLISELSTMKEIVKAAGIAE